MNFYCQLSSELSIVHCLLSIIAMKLFDVYPLFNVEIVKGKGCHVWDSEGNEYLDLYGGHAVISVGHSHPTYVKAITDQVNKLGFYSNSVINSLQQKLADKLGKACGYDDYSLFLINSGAEACTCNGQSEDYRSGERGSGGDLRAFKRFGYRGG